MFIIFFQLYSFRDEKPSAEKGMWNSAFAASAFHLCVDGTKANVSVQPLLWPSGTRCSFVILQLF